MYVAVALTCAYFQFLVACFATKLVKREVAMAQGSLCNMINTDAVILEDKLYFMGGEYLFKGVNTSDYYDGMYWLDLKTSFPVEGVIPPNVLQSITFPNEEWWGGGAMFTDSLMTTLYRFHSYGSPGFSTAPWFNATTQTWGIASIGDPIDVVEEGGGLWASTSTSGLGLSFITGGTGLGPLSGMIVFDASDPNNLAWTNKTLGKPTFYGTMQYARFGNKGVLIVFGGSPQLGIDSLHDMSLIYVYDIDSDRWFNVTATGDVPSVRSKFCSVISASPDDSSFQITFYGGHDIDSGIAFTGVYVLAIPAFRYINVTSTSNLDTQLSAKAGSYGTTCALYEDRQMVVLGGINSDNFNASCNSSWSAIRQLDTTTFEWQDAYNPGFEPYAVPYQVSNVIGGGPSGDATLVSPAGGFNDSALGPIFKKTIPRVTINSTSTSASMSPTASSRSGQGPASTTPSSSTSNSMEAIAGGVVGGVIISAIASALVCVFCYRRRKRDWLQRESITRKRNDNVHELHGDDRPGEIDSNALVESPLGDATTAPVLYEMSASRE